MVLGDRGDAVRKEQERLNALGADLKTDGVWGPLTQAAFEQYGSPDGGTTTTATTGPGSDLLLPGNAQLWYNETADEKWVVYEVPGVTLPDGTTSEPVFTSWLIETDADLEATFPVPRMTLPRRASSTWVACKSLTSRTSKVIPSRPGWRT